MSDDTRNPWRDARPKTPSADAARPARREGTSDRPPVRERERPAAPVIERWTPGAPRAADPAARPRPPRPYADAGPDRASRPHSERPPRPHGPRPGPGPSRPMPPQGARPPFERAAPPARVRPGDEDAAAAPAPASRDELRVHGLHACMAVFERRPEAVRKVYLVESRIPTLKRVLAWCVQHRLGYRVVEEADLERLTGSAHHEGVCMDVLRRPELSLTEWLRSLPDAPVLALWLDGVGNPHNLGAILRSAAHFGTAAVLLPKHAELALSGAACRVAEGGAEAVSMVRMGRSDNAIAQLAGAGFQVAASVVRGGTPLYGATLPARLALVLGAEREGVDPALIAASAERLSIPGSGAVDSLNVASATAVLLGEWWRQHRVG